MEQGKIVISNDYAKKHVINLTKLFERNIFILKMRSDNIKSKDNTKTYTSNCISYEKLEFGVWEALNWSMRIKFLIFFGIIWLITIARNISIIAKTSSNSVSFLWKKEIVFFLKNIFRAKNLRCKSYLKGRCSWEKDMIQTKIWNFTVWFNSFNFYCNVFLVLWNKY